MKIKAILGLMLGLFVAVGQASYSEDDAKARLLREYDSIMKEREKEAAKQAKEAERLAKEQVEAEKKAAEEEARLAQEQAENEKKLAEAQSEAEKQAIEEQMDAEKKMAEATTAEEKAAAEEEARQAKEKMIADMKAQREREKNMTDSEKMDVEVKRIKARMDEINGRIDNYHKANEMIDGLEKNLKELERKMGEYRGEKNEKISIIISVRSISSILY